MILKMKQIFAEQILLECSRTGVAYFKSSELETLTVASEFLLGHPDFAGKYQSFKISFEGEVIFESEKIGEVVGAIRTIGRTGINGFKESEKAKEELDNFLFGGSL